MDKLKNVGTIPKFNCTIGMLPTSFLESMSYQEQLTWLCNYISKDVTTGINDTINKYNELIDSFNTLHTDVYNELDRIEELLPSVAETIISEKIQSGELNCQLGTSYNASTEELTFTIQIVGGE